MAEGVLKHRAANLNLNIMVDSAGTSHWHIGEHPDKRAIQISAKNGFDISKQRARQLRADDFDEYDIIYAMDKSNYYDIMNLAKNEIQKNKVTLFLNAAYPDSNSDVHDPFYDGTFQEVFNIIDKAAEIIIKQIKKLSHESNNY
jgi:protein-tyrosine phosphatase